MLYFCVDEAQNVYYNYCTISHIMDLNCELLMFKKTHTTITDIQRKLKYYDDSVTINMKPTTTVKTFHLKSFFLLTIKLCLPKD